MFVIEFYKTFKHPQGLVFRDCWVLSENGKPIVVGKTREELDKLLPV